MDYLIVGAVAEDLGDFAGPKPADAEHVIGGIVGQAAGEFGAVAIAQGDDVAFVEAAHRLKDSDRQKTAAVVLDRSARAAIEDELPAGLGRVADPPFARRDGVPSEPVLSGCCRLSVYWLVHTFADQICHISW